MVKARKKLIEVALPLDAINIASAREKSILHGHPSTLHLWWARRPLAAARAVIFSQMVDDPSSVPEEFKTEEAQEREQQRLFRIIEELVLWENTTNEEVIEKARKEIRRSWRRACADNKDHPDAEILFNPEKLPGFHDPFAGGGALPLEAQRLGLTAFASDLNPVAVLINKAMIEIPPRFSGLEPTNPEWQQLPTGEKLGKKWKGAEGLAEDVRYYGQWIRKEAQKRIGRIYPKVLITPEIVLERPDLKPYQSEELTVIAWLWARTVKSPNPAFAQVDVPLISTFMLSTKSGKEVYVEPVVKNSSYYFSVKVGEPLNEEAAKKGTKLSRGANFQCLMSGVPIAGNYIKAEGKAGRMGSRLMAIVLEGRRERIYVSPTPEHEAIALMVKPDWKPELAISGSTQYLGVKPYGMDRFDQIFSNRQLVALTTFSEIVQNSYEKIHRDTISEILPDDKRHLRDGGVGAVAYAEAIQTYLAFTVSRLADYWTMLNAWQAFGQKLSHTFGRQAIPMVWDYAEANPFSGSGGSFNNLFSWTTQSLPNLMSNPSGFAVQSDAATQTISKGCLVSTDPPYYDNVPYADLSDFFYVWLRRSLKTIFPDLFATLAVPKVEELVAFAYRHEGKTGAMEFFLEGMTQAMHSLAIQAHPAFPVTIYYAFKQSENKSSEGTSSTGWETFLDAVIKAGFTVCGTWPMRTELGNRLVGMESNALASSIILVCRKREIVAPMATRKEFRNVLKNTLPGGIKELQASNIAPVDLAQASIGPGMEIFTRYSKILDASGETLKVRDALILINEILDEILAEQEGDFGPDTRWALAWYDQVGFKEGEFGLAETLSKAKNTSVDGLVEAGFLSSHRGKVRLLLPEELPVDWDPLKDNRLTEWEIVHHLIRLLAISEAEAAAIIAKLGSVAESARELAYRLYSLAERKKRSQEALQYNMLVQSWPELIRLAEGIRKTTPKQSSLFEG